ncbi:MAG: formylglycine-generating enzyme family protein [Deltaproteobacteria bacterium]|nr:formylglycine-generating enzyme family protein [Deltaproteobacteria bacterium]
MPEIPNLEDAVEFAGDPEQPSPPRSSRLRRGWRCAAAIMAGPVLLVVLLPQIVSAEQQLPPSPPSPAPAPAGMVSAPAGEFFMGCNEAVDKNCAADEKPGRTVYVNAFAVDMYEVTGVDYRRCVEAGKCTAPYTNGSRNWYEPWHATHPINEVDWNQADAYCRWAGKRLPTEAEWEKAARGTDGRVYPWGSEWDDEKANMRGGTVAVGLHVAGRRRGAYRGKSTRGETVAVGLHVAGASPYRVQDMAGNVWEWTADWYDAAYYQNGPTQSPSGPKTGTFRSVRGGSWNSHPLLGRASSRRGNVPGTHTGLLGFRCAQ